MRRSTSRLKLGGHWPRWFVLALTATGCSLVSPRPSQPVAEVKYLQLTGTDATKKVIVEVLQIKVMRFADNYAVTVAQAVDELSPQLTTTEARLAALRWKLSQATAAYVNATGNHPVLNALDMVVLATISRMVMEDELDQTFGEQRRPLLETHRRLETLAWEAVNRVLTPDQRQEFRNLIQEWRQKNPHLRYVGATRLLELAAALGKAPQAKSGMANSLLGYLSLDPLAGLDPTTAALQETRQVAERAMYYSQRMPTLLNWQLQLLALQLADQPEAKQLLADAQRISRSVETFAKVADQLPKLVNDQREAAIQQLFDGVAAERTNWLASVSAEEKKVRELLADARQTLSAGNELATSVHAAVKSVDTLVRYVNQTSASNPLASPASVPRKPFDISDYGEAASRVGAAAKELQLLVTAVDQSTPQVAKLSQQATADAERLLQRAFWLGLLLILILLIGSVLAGLTYRALANRRRIPDKHDGR